MLILLILWACTPSPGGIPTKRAPTTIITGITAAPIPGIANPATAVLTQSPALAATMPATEADQVKPQPGDAQLARGPAFIDSAQVRASPDRAGTALVSLKGSLPTACHQLRAQTDPPDANNRIAIDAYSVFDANRMCAQMIVRFDLVLPVSGLSADREYTVTVNGQGMLRFRWPLP